ncbi:AAA family ATPase [Aromatoleum buckelii]|uniref:AAA family ATPase n=1 Tax=Aromatoleum buckelii TaxID=200254 RepID=A0ABX1N1X5_9RHOO|nr:AAA family ATPase [Aromatoleum buckelii]MCK0510167.1 ATP-binding protein [Aromatoleum buckelii]
MRKLAGGRYEVDAEGNISFTPYKKQRAKGGDMPTLDLHLTSSTVKSLFGLWFYLEHQAQPGDVLMIDEPELNLHPTNQRQIARLIARLVNAGLHVVASTHSDYFVREINSMIMLGRPHPEHERLMKLGSFLPDEVLTPGKVCAYLVDQRELRPMEVTSDEGIIAMTFDTEIHSLNETSDEIYYAYRDIEIAGQGEGAGE